MNVVLFVSLTVMAVLFILSGIISPLPVWEGGIIGIIVFFAVGSFSARLLGKKDENVS